PQEIGRVRSEDAGFDGGGRGRAPGGRRGPRAGSDLAGSSDVARSASLRSRLRNGRGPVARPSRCHCQISVKSTSRKASKRGTLRGGGASKMTSSSKPIHG